VSADVMTDFMTLQDVYPLTITAKTYQEICQDELLSLFFYKKLGRHAYPCSFSSFPTLTALQIHHSYLPRNDCVLHHRRGTWDFFFQHDPCMIHVCKNSSHSLSWFLGLFHRLLHSIWKYHPVYLWHNQLVDNLNHKMIRDMMYYEIRIDKLQNEDEVISMGFSTFLDFGKCLERQWLVGWTESSIGLHIDDGHVYRDMVDFYRIHKARKIVVGDTIGCGYLLDRHQIFFTRNGELLYPYIASCQANKTTLMHPCIIATSTTQSFSIQWGFPFLFDLYHFRQILDNNQGDG
jgi:hypothetical protein